MLLTAVDRSCDHHQGLSIHVEITIESNHNTNAFRNNQNMREVLMFAPSPTNRYLIPVRAHNVQSKDHTNTFMHLDFLMGVALFFFFFNEKRCQNCPELNASCPSCFAYGCISLPMRRRLGCERAANCQNWLWVLLAFSAVHTNSVSVGSNMCLLKLQELFLPPWTMLHSMSLLDFFSS